AVRIDRRVRDTSANECRSVKRGGAEGLMGPTRCYCEPGDRWPAIRGRRSEGGDQRTAITSRRSEAGGESLERGDQVPREGAGDEHDAHAHEQRPRSHGDHPVVPAEPLERAGEPLDPETDQEERNAEPER